MARFEKQLIKEKNLTIIKAFGILSVKDLTDILDRFYAEDYTLNVVWDYTAADFSQLSTPDVRNVLQYAIKCSKPRKGGKSAILVEGDLPFGLGRLYETYAEYESEMIDIRSFKTLEEAFDWMGIAG